MNSSTISTINLRPLPDLLREIQRRSPEVVQAEWDLFTQSGMFNNWLEAYVAGILGTEEIQQRTLDLAWAIFQRIRMRERQP